MVNFKDQSRYVEGSETVSVRVVDSVDAVSVDYALFAPINKQQLQWLATLGIEPCESTIKLDDAQLGGAVPIQGSRIDRGDATKWRVKYVAYTHVTGVHQCFCVKQ